MKKVLILCLIFLINLMFADSSPKVANSLLIQLFTNDNNVIESLESKFTNIDLKSQKMLSRRMNIWSFKYDSKTISENDVIAKLKSDKRVKIVQFNHEIERREFVPNDDLFTDQWALNNTGQTGLEDSDIDAPEAWDFGTSGVTALGDTIVIAIIDGGTNFSHPDLYFWKNYNEIPNNNIDDDNNGYVDDYHGWNAYQSSGNVGSHSHGTHVAGIAAAKGNNGIGISGVAMNAQIMPLAGDSNQEAIAVAAYSYILEQRSLYNETDGELGAFVVVTNASFGVDMADPDDFPLWSEIYNTLGQQGVLSCGATANANWDIDEVGDVPTACDSDYLISVTNTTSYDEKYGSAGYGATTIDLGAPGTLIRSTDTPNESYSNKTGTSMATPHVAGAIGFLFGIAPVSLMNAYQQNPAEVALQMKSYILDGVDSIETLEGHTVTGGRLNLFNSAEILLENNDFETEITEDTTWSEDIMIMADVTVHEGAILTIDEGLEILFNGHHKIIIEGKLLANGTDSNPIVFDVADSSNFDDYETTQGSWDGLLFSNNEEKSELKYVDITHVKKIGDIDNEGAITLNNAKLDITNSKIHNNYSKNGSAMFINESIGDLENNRFYNNFSTENGGAISMNNSENLELFGNLFYANFALTGGAIYCSNSSLELINNTITNNNSTYGGGVAISGENNFFNNIIYDNNAPFGSQIYLESSNSNFTRNLIEGGEEGIEKADSSFTLNYEENIDDNPDFITLNGFGYALSAESSCVDVGITNLFGVIYPETDIFGNSRIINQDIDLGCYEYNENSLNEVFNLKSNLKIYPNPFIQKNSRGNLAISFNLREQAYTKVNIYNLKGQIIKKVLDEKLSKGSHNINWNGFDSNNRKMSSGLYFVKISSSKQSLSKKFILIN